MDFPDHPLCAPTGRRHAQGYFVSGMCSTIHPKEVFSPMKVICQTRRAFALALLLLLLAAARPIAAQAASYVQDDRFYAQKDGILIYISDDRFLYHFSGQVQGVTLCGYTGQNREIVIPEEINSRAVAAIEKDTFSDNSRITSVTIPSSVEEVGEGCFCRCEKLKSVTFAGSMKVLDTFCNECPRLEGVSIPYGVTEIRNSFRRCEALTDVTFSTSLSRLEDGCFRDDSALRQINWSTGLTFIGDAFDGCGALTELRIPKGVTEIRGAFDNCASLTKVDLPDSLLYLNGGFNQCAALESVTMPGGIAFIGDAFCDCPRLSRVKVPAAADVDQSAFVNSPKVKYSRESALQKTDSIAGVLTLIVLITIAALLVALWRRPARSARRRQPVYHDSDLSRDDRFAEKSDSLFPDESDSGFPDPASHEESPFR